MLRDYYINGETMVLVDSQELGITTDPIKITPRFVHQDIHCDDFGPNIPPEVMWLLADAVIRMTLIHYDSQILQEALADSMANADAGDDAEGTFVGAGSLMGANGDNYVQLGIKSALPEGIDWYFPTAYLMEQPMELPLGTERSLVVLTWRAVPYTPITVTTETTGDSPGNMKTTTTPNEVVSAGAKLWSHTIP